LTTVILATESFIGLIKAQAKARRVEPRLIVMKHPVGGLNAEELRERIDTAFVGLCTLMEEQRPGGPCAEKEGWN
jgi:hypothetical protein